MDRARATRVPAERSEYTVRARATLRAINDGSSGLAQRRALANLGVLEQWVQRQQNVPNPAAIQHLMDYLRKYPESPWAWVAALRLGKAHEARDAWDAASKVYADAAQRYASAPVAAALAHEYAAQAHEALGQFNQAIAERERAIQRWDDDYGPTYSLYMMREPRPDEGFTALGADDAAVVKSAVVARLAQGKETLRAPGGALLERARWELAHDQRDAAIETLAQLVKEQPQSPIASSVRALSHRARVDRALEAGSAADLESLAKEPYDYWICASKMARAAMLWRDGHASAAEALMTDALSEWHRQQGNGVGTAALADIARDVLEIRNVVFRPNGDGPFSGTSWELRSLAPSKTPFFIVNPEVRVKLPGGETQVTVRRAFPDYSNVLFFDTEQLAFFDRLMARVGGTERAVPATVMSVPNQPAGRSAELLKFLQQFFPARPGHWGGWMFQTFPMITRIEFEDAARTRAAVFVTVGYEGATLVFEKQGGVWTFKEMTGRWIT
jgi:tetratricopeptide (TPR) repeat protein